MKGKKTYSSNTFSGATSSSNPFSNNPFVDDGIIPRKRISSHKGHAIPNAASAKTNTGDDNPADSITKIIKLQMMQRQLDREAREDKERLRNHQHQQMMQMMMLSFMPRNNKENCMDLLKSMSMFGVGPNKKEKKRKADEHQDE